MVVDDVAPPRRCVIRRRVTYHGVLYENAEKRSIFRNCFPRGLIVKIVLKKSQIAKKLHNSGPSAPIYRILIMYCSLEHLTN